MTEQTDAAEVEGGNAAFYAEHYSDWTVHALPLMVYVPTGDDRPKVDAMELVQEILTEAAFDIRIEPLDNTLAAREAAARAEALREAADAWTQGGWSDVMLPKPTPPAVPVIAYSNRMGDWLRDRAASIARTDGAGS